MTHRSADALREDAIILHSIARKRRAAACIKAGGCDHVSFYFDADAAGLAATK